MEEVGNLKEYIEILKKEHNLSISIQAESENNIPHEQLQKFISPICKYLGIASQNDFEIASNDLIDAAKNFIQAHFKEDISSNDICLHLNCSRSLISHSFKTRTGLTIREYIVKLRLEYAKYLLETSNLTITEIAFAAGFGSSNYFTNVFKKQFNVAPGVYKKTLKKQKS